MAAAEGAGVEMIAGPGADVVGSGGRVPEDDGLK